MKAIHDKAFSAPEPSLIPLGFILQEPGQAEPPVNDNVYFNQLYRSVSGNRADRRGVETIEALAFSRRPWPLII